MKIQLKPIAFVTNSRIEPTDDHWSPMISEITLAEEIPTESLDHIVDFSHLEIIYYFDKVDENKIVFAGHPRGNPSYPCVGIFAQRKKDRPNKIGLCTVVLISHHERSLTVKILDAINNTPIIDIKPVMKEFMPKGEVRQPEWVGDLMKNYW